jgi:hypothetical protein
MMLARDGHEVNVLERNPAARLPPAISDRDARPGDERLVTWTARRTTLEHVVGRAAESQPGADAWACTNPSLGRGIALALLHASLLRGVVREHGGRPVERAPARGEATERELTPWYPATVAVDRATARDADRGGTRRCDAAGATGRGRRRARARGAAGRVGPRPGVFRASSRS